MNETLTNFKAGFIGLGLMGKPMCLNLHRAGADLSVFNRTRSVARRCNNKALLLLILRRRLRQAAILLS